MANAANTEWELVVYDSPPSAPETPGLPPCVHIHVEEPAPIYAWVCLDD